MDYLESRLRKILNEELIKRLLIQYFLDKGIQREDFNKNVYAPMLQDILQNKPQFIGKLEVQPFIEDMDPNNGKVKLGWNMFVLGNNRIYLGKSSHKNLAELKDSANGPIKEYSYENYTTPSKIITFISSVLSKSEQGFVDEEPDVSMMSMDQMSPLTNAQFYGSSQGFEKNKPVF
jgi:hypothetical protein